MNRMRLGLLFVAVLGLITTNFSGCKAAFSVGATGKGDAKTGAKALPDEPEVRFKDLQGGTVTLASLKGKVVLVNFWATWCEPCQVEIPWMIEYQQKYADKGFTLLGVAMDEGGKKVVDPFVKATQFDVNGQEMLMNYPIVLGSDDIADQFGGLIGLPTTVIISRDGKIQKKYIGLANFDELDKQIQGLL